MRQRRVAGAAVTAAAVLVLGSGVAGCEPTTVGAGETPGPTGKKPASQHQAGKAEVSKARRELSGLRIAPEGSQSGYARTKFGQAWKDVDHNGCDTRNDILSRDLKSIKKRGRCVVIGGELQDPYTGKAIHFVKADASEVQIDHVYPLALAWRDGAKSWPETEREQFANDPGNLLAVWGRPNQQKSDKGPAEWKPQKSFQCTYAVKFIGVADKYKLSVTSADHDALQDFLALC
ncbi:HNH endonuclease family protein [Actinomadura scrupuli]|uniref:HNH endonuclease family protein n=1 Tax=Actinomadura scrupuli TaxID=559629 RepID=UPI003D98240C